VNKTLLPVHETLGTNSFFGTYRPKTVLERVRNSFFFKTKAHFFSVFPQNRFSLIHK